MLFSEDLCRSLCNSRANRDLKNGYKTGIVKIRAFCGQKFQNQIFHSAVRLWHSVLCINGSLFPPFHLDPSHYSLPSRQRIPRCVWRGLWPSKTLQLNYGCDIQPTSGHKRHTVAAGEAAGQTRRRCGEKKKKKKNETKRRERNDGSRRSRAPGLISTLEDSVVWQADWQTRGRKLENVEGMWMKECIYHFVLGQLATLTEFSYTVEHQRLLTQRPSQ